MLNDMVGGTGRVEFRCHAAPREDGETFKSIAAISRMIIVRRQDYVVWIYEPDGNICENCFVMWLDHEWSRGLRTSMPEGPETPALPLIDAYVDTQIASFAKRSATGSAFTSTVRRVSTIDGVTSDQTIIRHPNCPNHHGTADEQPRETAEPALAGGPSHGLRETTLPCIADAILPLVYDRRLGVVRSIVRNRELAFAGTAAASLYPFRTPFAVEKGFGRSGIQRDDPVIAAVEALERFAGMQPRVRSKIVRGRFSDLRDRAIDPESFILHGRDQLDEPGFDLRPYDPDASYYWVPGYSFRHDAQILVPQQIAYYDRRAGSDAFVFEVSNGCAAGATLVEAALHGLFETVERDAFLGAWHVGKPVRRIDLDTCPSAYVHAVNSRLEAEGLVADAYDLSTLETAIRSVAVRIRDPELRFGPAAIYGSGGHVDAERALEGALAEAVTNIRRHSAETRRRATEKGLHLIANPTDVRTMDDHQLLCWPREALTTYHFVESSGPPAKWSDVMSPRRDPADANAATLLKTLTTDVLQRCADVVIVDQGFYPVADRGLRFAKILVPGLLPMTFGHQYRRLSDDRLQVFAGNAGIQKGRQKMPHVFP